MSKLTMNVINSNDLSLLSAICSNLITNKTITANCSPFIQDKILVMNKGMQIYLQQEIALNNGICSGSEFSQIWGFIWDLHKSINGADKHNRFSHEHMTWSIMSLQDIWNDKTDPIFSALNEYVESDEFNNTTDRTYQLCGVIADTFDQYQMYRPDWILAWDDMVLSDFDAATLNEKDELELAPGKLKTFVDETAKGNESVRFLLYSNLWQIKLWVLLKGNLSDVENYSSASLWDRPTVLKNLIKKISSFNGKIPDPLRLKLPRKVFIFGISALPSQVINLFVALGEIIPVFFMHLNPCKEYWGDLKTGNRNWQIEKKRISNFLMTNSLKNMGIDVANLEAVKKNHYKTIKNEAPTEEYFDKYFDCYEDNELVEGNPLLISLGIQGRDTLNELLSYEEKVDFTHAFCRSVDGEETDTVLNHLKDMLLTLNSKNDGKVVIKPGDNSLQIHSCHTPRRELEVLRDAILNSIKTEYRKTGEAISPKNILVMVPDIESYAPQIEAVFGAVEKDDPNYLPYAICDKSSQSSSKVADAIIKLLSIGISPINANLILELLSVEALAAKFEISSTDLSVISNWFKNTAVHWGLDETDVNKTLHTDENQQIDLPWTAQAGIDRLLDGFMTGTDSLYGGYDNFDTSDYALLNKLYAFIDKLKEIKTAFDPELNIKTSDWTAKLNDLILQGCFIQDDKTNDECNAVRKILVDMSAAVNNLKHNDDELVEIQGFRSDLKIKLPAFRAKLIHAFGNEHETSLYLRGCINFCSLMPMRAVPFEHIYVLGLNDGEFPRKDTTPSFNLMRVKNLTRRNDRSRVIDDRYIFLEALLSAKKSLYLSYIGQSPIDKTQMNPSVLITELKDYIFDRFTLSSDHELTEEENAKAVEQRLFKQEYLNSYDLRNYEEKTTGDNVLPSVVSFNSEAFWKADDATLEEQLPLGLQKDLQIEMEDEVYISIEDMLKTFRDASANFLKKNFNISLRVNYDTEVSDTESFEINSASTLNRLVKDLLVIKNDDPVNFDPEAQVDLFIEKQYQKGQMPYGVFFDNEKQKIKEMVSKFLGTIDSLSLSSFSSDLDQYKYITTVNVNGKDVKVILSGNMPLFSNLIIDTYRDSKLSLDTYLEALLRSMLGMFCTKGSLQNIKIIDRNACVTEFNLPLGEFDTNKCKEFLDKLIRIYLELLVTPIPLTISLRKGLFEEFSKKTSTVKSFEEYAVTASDIYVKDDASKYLFEDEDIFENSDKKLSEKQRELLKEIFDFIKDELMPVINTKGDE